MITEWNIEDLLDLPSVDSSDFWRSRANRLETVRASIHAEHMLGKYHVRMASQIAADGINAVPVHVCYGEEAQAVYADEEGLRVPSRHYGMLVMGNGHHRLKIMLDLGLTRVRVTDDPSESDAGPGIYSVADLTSPAYV
jgi:hypothetical protein